MTYTITIPNWHPTRLNELLGNHFQASRLKKADREMVGIYAFTSEVPHAQGKRRVTLKITLGPGERGGDADAYWKSLLDALVCCGRLVDDNSQQCEIVPVQYDRGERKTVIILEDLDPATKAG